MNHAHLTAEICRLWPTMPDAHIDAIVTRFGRMDISDGRLTIVLTRACATPQGMRPVKDVVIEALAREQQEQRGYRPMVPVSGWRPPAVGEDVAAAARQRRAGERDLMRSEEWRDADTEERMRMLAELVEQEWGVI